MPAGMIGFQEVPMAQSTYTPPNLDRWARDPETGYMFQPIPPGHSDATFSHQFDLEKKKAFVDLYKACFPNMTEALREVGVSRRTVYWHMKFDNAFKQAIEEIREQISDNVESRLYKDALTPKQFMAQIAILRAYRPALYTEKRINLSARDLEPSLLQSKAGTLGQVIDTQLVEAGTQDLAPVETQTAIQGPGTQSPAVDPSKP